MKNGMNPGGLARLESYIEEIMEAQEAVGLALAVVEANGEPLLQRFYGVRDRESRLPVNEDTIFGIASCTKSFTCLALRQLEEKGFLDCDDLLSRHVPAFTGRYQPGLKLRHLMSHSGGFYPLPRMMVDEVAADLGISDESEGDLAYSEKLAVEGARRVAERLDEQAPGKGLIGPPGLYYSYCNDGYGLLSEVIRKVSSTSFADYLKEHILQPLGMARSGCDFVKPARDDNAATLYRKKDGVMTGDRNYHDRAFVLNGGGAMKSTLKDMCRYLQMFLREGKNEAGEAILSQEALGRMWQPLITDKPGSAYANGLGVRGWGDLRIYSHGGSLPGVSSHILFSPDAGAGVVVLCNTSSVSVGLIAEAAMRLVLGQEPVPERVMPQPFAWDALTRESLPGIYRSGEGTVVEIRPEEDGFIAAVEGKSRPLIPVSRGCGVMEGRFSDDRIYLHRREGRVFAIGYGSRMIPKESQFPGAGDAKAED